MYDRRSRLGALLRGAALVASCALGCTKATSDAAPTAAVSAVAPLPSAPAEVSTVPTAPAAPLVTYAVFGVKGDDVLNVRSEPSASSKKVHAYAPSMKGIVATGHELEHDKTPWIEVKLDVGTGWINRLFLTEQHAGNGCDDPNLTAAIRAFMRAVAASDGAALQALISPLRGLSIRQAHWNPTVNVPHAEVPALLTSPTPRKWGSADGSGEPIVEPFKAHLWPQLQRAVNGKAAQEKCGSLIMGASAGSNEWPAEYANLTHVSFHHPGPEGFNQWVTWVLGMEYVDAKPYVATLVQYQWEI